MATANGTKLWLEEGVVHAGKMLQDLMKVEECAVDVFLTVAVEVLSLY